MRDRSSADDFVVWTDNDMLKKKKSRKIHSLGTCASVLMQPLLHLDKPLLRSLRAANSTVPWVPVFRSPISVS